MLLSTEASKFLGQKLKSYNVDIRLGRGTFGAVFTGIRKAPDGREVAAAVKVQRAENVREFSTERQCLETLQKHPHCNVIHTWAIFHDIPGHCVVLVMEAGILSLLQLESTQYAPQLVKLIALAHLALHLALLFPRSRTGATVGPDLGPRCGRWTSSLLCP